ncbi:MULTISPECIES: glycine cleavage system aminomethyltransferase GcvT [unclassified Azospirillum]|uniref:glycine cleavage system aminomethyltransferase GcvT n=1 Tax=unclassified Azospirillum TaxID=2630922 RepID=UPI000B6B9619|nr:MULTISPECIES: glycine cleavage system aminomethyltransferase GcvT [unclassified Azospirillum]SNR87777.1 aminomethyltransferase [Azospirillum sp. RU38E]SNS03966.1 aminomethyltransferase [Azospirillum sp. RU37A]
MGDTSLLRTPLYDLHVELGAKMVPFAGYDMPVQYPLGVLKEHLHTREKAGLFDVSHMGQVRLRGADIDTVIKALEALVPGDIAALAPGRIRYTMFTNDQAGILDDLMVTRFEDHLYVVINAGCKAEDLAHLKAGLPAGIEIEYLGDDAGLLALQGPAAATVMARLLPEAATMGFMSARTATIQGIPVQISRSGYTGEDGYEISVGAADAEKLARLLLAEPEVAAIGLGARDSLRLEAGLCLYGHDIDTGTNPVEAALTWTISKRRRTEGGFPGAAIVQAQLAAGPARKRVGIQPEGKAPAREHTEIQDLDGNRIGEITSGGFGPTAGGPVAMGYVTAASAAVGTRVQLIVRGKAMPATVAALPFAPHRYFKG